MEPTRSQQKKAAKRARIDEKYRQQKLAKKANHVPDVPREKDSEGSGARGPRQERNAMFKADFESNCERGPTVIIDCDWRGKMTDKEVVSLTQQVMYSYAANKRGERCVRLCVYGASQEQINLIQKLPGADTWYMTFSTRTLDDLSIPKSAIYLTADSEDMLDVNQLSTDDTLIIGGIVDRNRFKKATLLKAEALGLRTAQLPIGEFMPLKSSKVLTVNHVVQILVDVLAHKDWKRALDSAIPDRKREVDNPSD